MKFLIVIINIVINFIIKIDVIVRQDAVTDLWICRSVYRLNVGMLQTVTDDRGQGQVEGQGREVTRMKVVVSHCVSPGELYVQDASTDAQKALHR